MTKRTSAVRGALMGAGAGAAGTTALNAVTYVDMAWRARPASRTPEETVAKLADQAGIEIPGDEKARANRLSALGPLSGLLTGVGVGAVVGLLQVWTPARRTASLAALATGLAMLGSNGPMTVLEVTNPAEWSLTDWLSDAVPHLAYGATTAMVLQSRAPA